MINVIMKIRNAIEFFRGFKTMGDTLSPTDLNNITAILQKSAAASAENSKFGDPPQKQPIPKAAKRIKRELPAV